jgi:hypothetical protein
MQTLANKTEEGPVVDDVAFWACVLDVTEAQLEFVLRMVGRDANAVGRYMVMLGQQRVPCH